MVSFLNAYQDTALDYFRRQSSMPRSHESNVIDFVNDRYRVYLMDHQVEHGFRIFERLTDAVAEHVLRTHGMTENPNSN
jgi:hypothetical protein